MQYHRRRPGNYGGGGFGPADDSDGGAGPDDESGGSTGPHDDSSRSRSNDGQVGADRGGSRVHKVGDAPWGQVGNQRIGIDIPLIIEDKCSDEEMDFEEFEMNSNANDAPWGRVGDKRIGIDIPLVIEDIYSDEEMDLIEEFQKQDDGTNVDKLESSSSTGITIWPNPSDKDGSGSHTISKPYFVIDVDGRNYLLEYNHEAEEWRWMQNVIKRKYGGVSIGGLVYKHSSLVNTDDDGDDRLWRVPRIRREPTTRRVFDWHTKKSIRLPPPPDESFTWRDPIVGMIVDTSMQPYAFRVIEGSDKGTIIYDSTTQLWTHLPSVPPESSKIRSRGNADMASCKDTVFIIDDCNRIVLYDTKEGKWDRVPGPTEHAVKKLCGLGSWGDRVFSFTECKLRNGAPGIKIKELVSTEFKVGIEWKVGTANLKWKKFDVMPREIGDWLRDVPHPSSIDVSYCSEYLLIWASSRIQSGRFVLYNLARKEWKTFEAPFLH